MQLKPLLPILEKLKWPPPPPPYSNLASATLMEPHNEVSVKLVESSIEVDAHEMLVSTGGEASDLVEH